jgi:hypothetical protein
MATTYLKNKVTGELKKIEAGCQEYLDLVSERIKDIEGVEDQPHRSLWEDRGVAGHAEVDEQPAKGNVNDRNYDNSLVGATPELGIDPDIAPVSGDARELHAKVANSGTTAEGSPDPNASSSDEKSTAPPEPASAPAASV